MCGQFYTYNKHDLRLAIYLWALKFNGYIGAYKTIVLWGLEEFVIPHNSLIAVLKLGPIEGLTI